MIEIILNGKTLGVDKGISVEELIQKLGLNSKWVVVELNQEALMRKDYAKTLLRKNDKVELVRAVSGG